jgi:hypothetical protein
MSWEILESHQMLKYCRVFFGLILLFSCSDRRPFLRQDFAGSNLTIGHPNARPDGNDILTFFALGDWGTGESEQVAVARALSSEVAKITPNRSVAPFVLGLGDNVYENGLEKGWGSTRTTELLHRTFGQVYDKVKYNGRNPDFHIVPGNHDHHGTAGGKSSFGDVIHQETTAEAMYTNWRYYPIDPAENTDTNDEADYNKLSDIDILRLAIPERIPIPDDRLLLAGIDTQVMLDLNNARKTDLLQRHLSTLDSLLAGDARWKILVGHHPVRTHGTHGGFRSGLWWAPPMIFITLIDKFFWRRLQDTDHPAYKRFQSQVDSVMVRRNVALYLSGHEHSLQMLSIAGTGYQVISGSSGKLSPVTHKDDTIFSHQAHGFVRFDLAEDELWIEFFEVDVSTDTYVSTAVLKMSYLSN